jgi:hypothetical protein
VPAVAEAAGVSVRCAARKWVARYLSKPGRDARVAAFGRARLRMPAGATQASGCPHPPHAVGSAAPDCVCVCSAAS